MLNEGQDITFQFTTLNTWSTFYFGYDSNKIPYIKFTVK